MHSVNLEERKSFSATDVKEVAAFSDKEVRLVTKNDNVIVVSGEGLTINGFSKQSGAFSLTGNVREVRYSGAKESFFKRIFK